MRTVAIIQARMASTRLPGKILAEVCGKPLLQHMLDRLYRCETLDDVCVATPTNDARLAEVALYCGAKVWGGPEEDVLSRVLGAARHWEADAIVELTADCPLIDPAIVDDAVRIFKALKAPRFGRVPDLLSTSRDSFSLPAAAYPRGMDVRVFLTETLAEVDRLTQDPGDREHVSLYIWEHPEYFRCYNHGAPRELQDDVRLTVDYPEDLELVRTIFEEFLPHKPDFGLADILELLAYRPELRQINAHVEQKAIR